MTRDQDRAEELARAIEEMVSGRAPDSPDDKELDELLQIARIRLDAARSSAEAGSAARESVLERLVARLREAHGDDVTQPGHILETNDDTADLRDLQDVIELNRNKALQAAAISEAHREPVWRRVQARLQAGEPARHGLFLWPFRRRHGEAYQVAAAVDRLVLGEPIWETEGSHLQELLRVARVRQAAAAGARSGLMDQQVRVWARVRPRLLAAAMRFRRPRVSHPRLYRETRPPWAKLAAAGAVVAVVAAALGPIPATGLANHPVADFARFVGGSVGVTETSAPPDVPPVTVTIEGNDVSVQEAGRLLGLPVHEPTIVPAGYVQVSSQYFPRPLTANDGGLFALAYENEAGGTILIYQENASANTIVVEDGFAQSIWLGESVPATLVVGTWRPAGGELDWGEDGSRTILFDLGGLRTIIHTTDADIPLAELAALGGSLAENVSPPTG